MSSASAPSAGQWPPKRPSKRSKLRNGTWIIPATGERTRRQFSFSSSSDQAGPAAPEDGIVSVLAQDTLSARIGAAGHNLRTVACRFWAWLNTPKGRGVLKCTLAYVLGSLATFLPFVSDFLGRPDGKHVVATLTVYFHPSRSVGSMILAIGIAIIAVCYAEVISLLSMAVAVLFGSTLGMLHIAHVLILVFFIGGGLGFVGWVKQKLNHPLVNVGSTLTSLAIISVVTKETAVQSGVFSNQKIVQVLKMLVMGITISSAVNMLVWRVSARAQLRESMTKCSVSLGEMLATLTRGFLSGSEDDLDASGFKKASAEYSANYNKMVQNQKEVKFEHYVMGREKIYHLDKAVIKSLEALAQSIGGLRSAATTQFALLKEAPWNLQSGPLSPIISAALSPPAQIRSPAFALRTGRFALLSAIDESPDEAVEADDSNASVTSPGVASPKFHTPSDIFELFIVLLGPSMKSLAYTLSEILREPPFGPGPKFEILINDHFRSSLTDAIGLYNTSRAIALQEVYQSIELIRSRPGVVQADFEEVAAACGHFSFTLQAFGEEMQKYLDVLDDLKLTRQIYRRSWRWVLFWRHAKTPKHTELADDPEQENLLETVVKPIRQSAVPKGIPDSMVKRRDTMGWHAAPEASKVLKGLSQKALRLLRFFGRDDIRFGVKVGLGAALWAMLAFLPHTQPLYQHWRGEWGLLSFMIVCSMTVGSANTTGWARFLGTIMGAVLALVNWNISQGNPFALAFLGSLVSFFNFYIILEVGNAPMGRICLLAYNVCALYAYSISRQVDDDDDDEGGSDPLMSEIVMHRVLAVMAGILWGLVVCRLVWPISARNKFKEGLSVLYLQMGLIWKRGPLAILFKSDCTRSYLRAGEQAALQRYASRLKALRTSAAGEFELRGPFPFESTGRLMASTDRILDAFYAMNVLMQQRRNLTEGERALLHFTSQERAQLCDRICHVFQVLASSMMLEYPLTDAIPSVAGHRDRLLQKIFTFRKNHSGKDGIEGVDRSVVVHEKDYALLYAYALVTGQVAKELKAVRKEIESLYGVLNEESLLLQ